MPRPGRRRGGVRRRHGEPGGPPPGGSGVGLVIGCEDAPLDFPEVGAGFGAELFHQEVPGALVEGERLGLPAGAEQGEHQLADQRLAQRVLSDQPPEFRDEFGVPAERQLGVEAELHRLEPQLLEVAALDVA